MKLTKRDYQGALEKLANAKFTERQLNALEDMILREAIERAEQKTCMTAGKVTHRLTGIGSLLARNFNRADTRADTLDAIRVAVFWYHELKGQRQELPAARHSNPYPIISRWRPE